MISLDEREVDMTKLANDLLARWDTARRDAPDRTVGDADFREWLMHTAPALLDATNQPPEENALAHCMAIGAAVNRCLSLDRQEDALTLSQWLVDSYVPRGDNLAAQTVAQAAILYQDAGDVPKLHAQAIRLFQRMIDAAPDGPDSQMELAVCEAMTKLSVTHMAHRDRKNWQQPTLASIKAADAVIARWSNSHDPKIQRLVAANMINKAARHLEIRDEKAAKRVYTGLIDTFSAEPEQSELGLRVHFARHALEVLNALQLPEPEFKTTHFDAQLRRSKRLRRRAPLSWALERVFDRSTRISARRREYIRAATQIHYSTCDFVRRMACTGAPWVLVLRNFDLTEVTFERTKPRWPPLPGESRFWPDNEEPETYGQVIRFPRGLRLLDRLSNWTDVVKVASTKSAALELDAQTSDIMGGRGPSEPWLLYLPDTGWLDVVRVLISLAERIIVWAEEKTPPLLDELALVTELGRADDVVVLLEDEMSPKDDAVLRAAGAGLTSGERFTKDDPILRDFPVVVSASETQGDNNPILHELMDSMVNAHHRSMTENVSRTRKRLQSAGVLGSAAPIGDI